MSLEQRLNDEIKTAMRAKDKVRLEALRALRGDVLKEQKSGGDAEITDELVQKFAKSQVKQRSDAVKQFRDAGRAELAEGEEAIIAVMREFLPEPVSAEKLTEMVDAAVAELEAPSMKEMGKVIGKVKGQIAAAGLDVDGGQLAGAVKAALSK